jgi:hypothetical protein
MSSWFPPLFLDWIFIVLVAPFLLAGITMTICILSTGRYLFRRRCYSLALVIARIECLFVLFGTILGVFTFIALSRELVKALFLAAFATIPTARQFVDETTSSRYNKSLRNGRIFFFQSPRRNPAKEIARSAGDVFGFRHAAVD